MSRSLCILIAVSCGLARLHAKTAFEVEGHNQELAKRATGETVEERAVSLGSLLQFLSEFRYDAVAESLLVGLVRMHGLSFNLSPSDKERLKGEGATDALVKALEVAPVHKPDPPRPPAAGLLVVACQPLDCDVNINGALIGKTQQGEMVGVEMPPGEVKVSVSRENYEVDRSEELVSIRSGATTHLRFRLAPSRAVIESEGTNLFKRMLSALGSESFMLGPDPVVHASGVLHVKTRGANLATWSAVITTAAPGVTIFQLSRGGRKYEMALKNEMVVWKKRPKDQDGRVLEEAIRLVLDYQLANLIQRFKGSSFRFLARTNHSTGLDPNSLRIQTDNESYFIAIDSDSRPTEVLLESAGLNNGTRVLFSRYTDLGGLIYPQETEVLQSEGRDGVALRFDRIERNAPAKSRRFRDVAGGLSRSERRSQ